MKNFLRLIAILTACVTLALSLSACNLLWAGNLLGYDTASAVTGTSVDAAKMTNDITTDKIHAIFTVTATNQKSPRFVFGGGSTLQSQGSGVAFYQNSSGYVFILTNCHVVQKREGYSRVGYTVTDYAGNNYTAYVYAEKGMDAVSADYDLACIYFRASSIYTTMPVAESDPAIGETVVALGSPEHQSNAITFGKVVEYITTEVDSEAYLSNVRFPVIYHDAFIDSGSSGGPIINSSYEVVGINYGGSEDNSISLSIPASKVREFLSAYVYD